MPLEIEIKLKVDAHAPIVERLRQLGAKHKGAVRETNIFFDRAGGVLRAAKSGLRVRLEAPLLRGNQKSKITRQESSPPTALITFKGPPRKSGLRSREAYDLTVAPADQLIPLLKSLGFGQTMLFEKNRDSWEYAKCKIELDTLPHFGTFLEVEGPSERAVKAAQKKLDLENLRPVQSSYANMVGEHLDRHPVRRRELRF